LNPPHPLRFQTTSGYISEWEIPHYI
jgi:hypothetical protein